MKKLFFCAAMFAALMLTACGGKGGVQLDEKGQAAFRELTERLQADAAKEGIQIHVSLRGNDLVLWEEREEAELGGKTIKEVIEETKNLGEEYLAQTIGTNLNYNDRQLLLHFICEHNLNVVAQLKGKHTGETGEIFIHNDKFTACGGDGSAYPAGDDQPIFVPSWDADDQPMEAPMIDGLYTITGKTYRDGKVNDSPTAGGWVMYIKVYSDKMVVTTTDYENGRDVDLTYLFERADKEGNRIYRLSNTNAFVIGSNGTVQWLTSIYTYNGNVRTDTYWELVVGNHREECLKRAKSAMDWENMKFMLGIEDEYAL